MSNPFTPRALAGWISSLLCLAAVSSAQFPDLTIREIDISPVNPTPGQEVSVTVTAENVGNAIPLDAVYVYLWASATGDGDPAPCTFDQSQALEIDFPSNTERLFNFTISYPTTGVHRLFAWIDGCEPVVDEWEEGNNTLARSVMVGVGDLQIMDITPSVPDPIPGQEFSLNVFVRNVGPAIIDQVWHIGLETGGGEPTTCIFDQSRGPFLGFAANQITTVSFGPFTYEIDGVYPIWGWVDCANNVVESDDSNNKLRSELVIGRPDLIVESVTPSVTTAILNQPFDVAVVVRNVGSRQAVSFEAAIVVDHLGDPGQHCPAGRQYVPLLASGASTTITFPLTLAESRSYRIWGVSDACDLLEEAREDNNTRSVDLNVGNNSVNNPDLVVESIRVFEIPSPEWGAVTTFDVTVRNVGSLTSAACLVGDFAAVFPGPFPSFTVIGTPGPSNGGTSATAGHWSDCTWRGRGIPSLTPGASATVQFWRYYGAAGRYSFSATVDVCGTPPRHVVYETSEANNSMTVEFDVVACDADADNDGICDRLDFCPNTYDLQNNDSDNDLTGDACDNDDDNDGVDDGADCAPLNPFVYPGAVENCRDGVDNNCDGQTDEGARTWFRDADGDTVGVSSDTVIDCAAPPGYVGVNGDCNDGDPTVYPSANGRCDDGVDNDCDGVVDNERPVWGRDADADGFSDAADVLRDDDGVCDGQPVGYILATTPADPDDADFMVPEPVRAIPERLDISRARTGRIDPALILLERRGTAPYNFDVSVTYAGDTAGWLAVNPASGTAASGGASIALTPNTSSLERTTYAARVSILINGSPALDIPVSLQVRNPILTVRHSGQGGGQAWARFFSNRDSFDRERVKLFSTLDSTFEGQVEVPEGESVNVAAYTEYDCSALAGIFDESGARLDDPNGSYSDSNDICIDCAASVGVVVMNGDRDVTVGFTLSGLACTACGPVASLVSYLALVRKRRSVR